MLWSGSEPVGAAHLCSNGCRRWENGLCNGLYLSATVRTSSSFSWASKCPIMFHSIPQISANPLCLTLSNASTKRNSTSRRKWRRLGISSKTYSKRFNGKILSIFAQQALQLDLESIFAGKSDDSKAMPQFCSRREKSILATIQRIFSVSPRSRSCCLLSIFEGCDERRSLKPTSKIQLAQRWLVARLDWLIRENWSRFVFVYCIYVVLFLFHLFLLSKTLHEHKERRIIIFYHVCLHAPLVTTTVYRIRATLFWSVLIV